VHRCATQPRQGRCVPFQSRLMGRRLFPDTVDQYLSQVALTGKLKGASGSWTQIGVQPREETADAARGQRNAGIGRAVIKSYGIPVRADGLPTRENDIVDISATFIWRFRTEYPRNSALQAYLRPLQIEERQPQAIDTSRCGLPHAMVDSQPTFCGFNRRRA